MSGPRLLGVTTLVLLALVASVLSVPSPGEAELRAVIRLTALVSLTFFVLAFTASALARARPGAGTRWLVANRRWIGLSFAVSHTVHAAAIVTLARRSPDFHVAPGTLVAGGLGFVMIALLAATSNDAAVRRLGFRRWRALHRTALYYLWFVFFVTYLGPAAHSPFHAAMVLLLLGALAARAWAWWRRRPGG